MNETKLSADVELNGPEIDAIEAALRQFPKDHFFYVRRSVALHNRTLIVFYDILCLIIDRGDIMELT